MDKPKIAAKKPAVIEVAAGKHAYCTCGQSSGQPYCDGSHAGTSFKPMMFDVAETRTCALCLCKQSGNLPYCDGSHANLD